MKKIMKRALSITMLAAVLMSSTISVFAEDTVEHQGDGLYTIEVHNGANTGISITGDWFHAYQIFSASDVTSYDVSPDFEGFFTGNSLKAGDGSGDVFNFQAQLDIIYSTTASETDKEAALVEYNQMAGLYMYTYENNMYTLAEQMRNYLDLNGAHGSGTIECDAHSQAVLNADGSQTATLVGLDMGYYFVFDQESTVAGLGIAASGAFVPITDDDGFIISIEVKDSVPTITKQIYHDDQNKWDVVGDHQIGDTVEFLITSTLPSNSDEYTTYTYVLTDVMSDGITYNADVKVYTDFDRTKEVNSSYLSINNDPDDADFTVDVNVKEFSAANPTVNTLYTYYTGVLNSSAVVATEHDKNTVTLEYSNNPDVLSQTGTSEATVFHYTFALNVNKVDESGNGLAGARFGIFDEDGFALPLTEGHTDYATGVVYYYYNEAEPTVADGGYITTKTVETTSSGDVTGLFQVYGLNDAKTYTLTEVAAPEGYNAIDSFNFTFTPVYNATGTGLTSLTDGSPYINTVDFESTATIINRMKIFLPETGGMGTIVFQVGGGVLMLGAVTMLLISKRKKEVK